MRFASLTWHQGRISKENLQSIARELGETMTDEEIEEMITAADLDKDGYINEEERADTEKREPHEEKGTTTC